MDTSDKLCCCCFKVAHVDMGDAGLPEFVYTMHIDIYIHTNMYQFVVDYMDVSQNYIRGVPSRLNCLEMMDLEFTAPL